MDKQWHIKIIQMNALLFKRCTLYLSIFNIWYEFCLTFGTLLVVDIWIARSAKIFGVIFWDFLDRWSYCHFLAGDDGHTGSLHEWWWWIPNFDQVMDGHYKRTPPPLPTYALTFKHLMRGCSKGNMCDLLHMSSGGSFKSWGHSGMA